MRVYQQLPSAESDTGCTERFLQGVAVEWLKPNGYPKAARVPANPRGEIADRAFCAAPLLRHVEVAMGIQHVGIAAWQSCQQLQIVRLPPSVISLVEGTFQGCYVLREVAAPGCVQCSRRVFAECCSLGRVGVSHETEDSNVPAPGAQLGKYAFESCLTLTTITFDMDHTNKSRALPEGAFCGAGIEQLCLPSDFHNIGPRACENCKRLVEVNLMGTEITALLHSTFAHCVALHCMWLPPRLTQIGKEVFLNCVVLQEAVIPTELSDIGKFETLWVELLPADGPDSDAFDEEPYHEFSQHRASPCEVQGGCLGVCLQETSLALGTVHEQS